MKSRMPKGRRKNMDEEGITCELMVGLCKEASSFQELIKWDIVQTLIRIFFTQHSTSKVIVVTDIGLKPRKISKVVVVGGGLMGSSIATMLVLSGYHLILKEVNEQFLHVSLDQIKENSYKSHTPIRPRKWKTTMSEPKGSHRIEHGKDNGRH